MQEQGNSRCNTMAQNSIENAISFFLLCLVFFSGYWFLVFSFCLMIARWLLIPQHFLKQQYLKKKKLKGGNFSQNPFNQREEPCFSCPVSSVSYPVSADFPSVVAMTGTPNAREAGRIRTWCFQSPCWMADSVCWEEVCV